MTERKPRGYLIIDAQCRIYRTPTITGYLRSQARQGNLSIVNLRSMTGMNASTIQSVDNGTAYSDDWSDIQEWDSSFRVESAET